MEKAPQNTQGQGRKGRGFRGKILLFGQCLIKSVFNVVFLIFFLWWGIIGASMCIVSAFPDDVPEITPLVSVKTKEAATLNTTPVVGETIEEVYEQLEPTLVILKEVCPEAEAWVRDRYRKCKFYVSCGNYGYFAAYAPLYGILDLNVSMFNLSDGEKAVILAHEFRHSRQNILKMVVSGATLIFRSDMNMNEHYKFIEYEAEEFERKARRSIFGREMRSCIDF